jgi:protein-tyrosine phosphatase
MFAVIFQRLADESNLPIIIHCAAGKDRSGTMIAVLLKLLGVPDETIAADYSLSNHTYAHSRKAAQRAFESLKLFGIREKDLAHLLIADAKVMAQALHHIDKRYGSVEAYLCDYVGLSQETLQAIRNNLLV